jgi:hypothetical protein
VTRLAAIFLLLVLAGATAADQLGGRRQYLELARQFELKPLAATPDWAQRDDKPLARLAWFTDLHLNADYQSLADQAFAYMNTLRPDAVLVTGDNCAYAPADFRPDVQGKYLRRWTYFKHLMDTRLDAPAAVLPGDNWPWDYEKVYGTRHFSFDLAGVHIIGLGTDRAARGVEGCAVFDDATWTWLSAELDAHPKQPTIVAMHENMAPPTFLDAKRLQTVLEQHPQVLATFTGHLHIDVEFMTGRLHHITCPALGPSLRHGFKEVMVYPDAIVLRTHELGEDKEFHPVDIWQRIAIPEPYRSAVVPIDRPYRLVRQGERPPLAKVEDPALKQQYSSLLAPAMQFLMTQGMRVLLPGQATQ